MEAIKKWLQDPEDYFAGVALYEKLPGCAPALLTRMKRKETAQLRDKLIYELKKHIPAEEKQILQKRQSSPSSKEIATPKNKAVKVIPERYNPKESVLYHQLPAELRPVLLEAHNFFNEMCLLKVSLNELLPEQEEEALELQLQIYTLRKNNELRWAKIDYWKEHKRIPEKPVTKEEKMNSAQLVKRQAHLWSSIGKLEKRYELNKQLLEQADTIKEKTRLEKAIAKQGANLLKQKSLLEAVTALIEKKDE
ncbi:hypothetical protein [Flavobacterium beibuense]|uniref:hypothetical protein n=1 Tax=Flavobacterium beibuense TaxID=657326 RepID=UPI003A94402D